MPDVAGLPRSHQPRHPERRIGTEHLGIEVQVVDPSVDDVHTFEPADRAHVHALVVADHEVGTLDELGTHPLGEEGMLEVRRVEDARREHDDLRLGHIVGRERRQQLVELVGVGVDGADVLLLEHLGEHPLGDGAVLEDVADTRRHAQVVLEDVHLAVVVAHEVGSRDVRPHAELGVHAAALRAVVRRAVEQLGREHTVGDHPLLVVDVVDEEVERDQALDETALDDRPLVTGDHTGDEIERPGTVEVGAVGVHRERDAHREDLDLGDPLQLGQLLRRRVGRASPSARRRRDAACRPDR